MSIEDYVREMMLKRAGLHSEDVLEERAETSNVILKIPTLVSVFFDSDKEHLSESDEGPLSSSEKTVPLIEKIDLSVREIISSAAAQEDARAQIIEHSNSKADAPGRARNNDQLALERWHRMAGISAGALK